MHCVRAVRVLPVVTLFLRFVPKVLLQSTTVAGGEKYRWDVSSDLYRRAQSSIVSSEKHLPMGHVNVAITYLCASNAINEGTRP